MTELVFLAIVAACTIAVAVSLVRGLRASRRAIESIENGHCSNCPAARETTNDE